jgi:hypothetical protein
MYPSVSFSHEGEGVGLSWDKGKFRSDVNDANLKIKAKIPHVR